MRTPANLPGPGKVAPNHGDVAARQPSGPTGLRPSSDVIQGETPCPINKHLPPRPGAARVGSKTVRSAS